MLAVHYERFCFVIFTSAKMHSFNVTCVLKNVNLYLLHKSLGAFKVHFPRQKLITNSSLTIHYNNINLSDNPNSFRHAVSCCCLFSLPLLSQILLMLEAYSESCLTSRMERFPKIFICKKLRVRCLKGFWICLWT